MPGISADTRRLVRISGYARSNRGSSPASRPIRCFATVTDPASPTTCLTPYRSAIARFDRRLWWSLCGSDRAIWKTVVRSGGAIAQWLDTIRLTPATALDLLKTRDAVEAQIGDLTSPQLLELDNLDRILKERLEIIVQLVDLQRYRQLLKPEASAWWWFGEPLSVWERFDWAWEGTSATALTVALALVVDTSTRLFAAGATTLGSLSVVGQSVLTLLTAKGALTKAGRQGLDRVFEDWRLPPQYWQEARSGVSVAVLLLTVAGRSLLPTVAQHFYREGKQDYFAGRLGEAVENYQIALALKSDLGEAQYHLGLAYEDLQEIESAQQAYQRVARGAPTEETRRNWLNATNNLGRLYVLQEKYDAAAQQLIRGLEEIGTPENSGDRDRLKTKFALLKNLAWVRLKQERYIEAENRLQAALALGLPDEETVAAHCLTAELREAQGQEAEARSAWEICLAYANPGVPDEDRWIGEAYRALSLEEDTNP